MVSVHPRVASASWRSGHRPLADAGVVLLDHVQEAVRRERQALWGAHLPDGRSSTAEGRLEHSRSGVLPDIVLGAQRDVDIPCIDSDAERVLTGADTERGERRATRSEVI